MRLLHGLEPRGLFLREIGALMHIEIEIEEIFVPGKAQIFPDAVAMGGLAVGLILPEELAVDGSDRSR